MSGTGSVSGSKHVLRRLSLVVVVVAATTPTPARDAQRNVTFEVASVRPNTSGETVSVGGALRPGGRFRQTSSRRPRHHING
jgi:hypothetical protein